MRGAPVPDAPRLRRTAEVTHVRRARRVSRAAAARPCGRPKRARVEARTSRWPWFRAPGCESTQAWRASSRLPQTVGACSPWMTALLHLGGPGRNRTCDTRFRKPLLSPLSYEAEEPRIRWAGVQAPPRSVRERTSARVLTPLVGRARDGSIAPMSGIGSGSWRGGRGGPGQRTTVDRSRRSRETARRSAAPEGGCAHHA